MQGHLDQARQSLQEALALQREVGDRWMIGNALNNLGNVTRDQGDYVESQSLCRESLGIYVALGDKCALAYLFEDLGCLAALQGERRRALCLAAVAASLREEISAPLTPSEAHKLDSALEGARQQLGESEQRAATTEGRAMSLSEALRLVAED